MQKFLSSLSLSAVLVAIWALSALLLRGTAPWFFWATMVCLPAIVLAWQEADFLRSKTGRRVLMMCGALLIIHVAWAFIRSQFYSAASTDTYWRDDHGYFIEAAAVADAWSHGFYPDISRKGALPYLGTLHTGYHRPLAAIFMLTGPSTLAALLLNAIFASLLPLCASICARHLWSHDNDEGETRDTGFQHVSGLRNNPAALTAVFCALHPNQFYWAAYLMKDTYVAFIFLATMALILGALRRRSLSMAVAALLVLPYFFTVRIYSALSLILGATLIPALRLRKKTVFSMTVAAVIIVFLICAYTHTGSRLYEQMRDSFVALAPAGVHNSFDFILRIFAGVPRLFLAPFAWLLFEEPNPMWGLYPGMWYLYLVAYPLGYSGLYAALRKNIKTAIIPLTAFGLASIIFLTAAFGGNVSRQRFYLEYVVFIFAGYGATNPSKWWIGGILTAEAAFAVGQVLAL